MKKIIALAVASAFVAPAFAADVSVSGAITYNYISSDAAATGDKVESDDNKVVFTATEELANGMSVKGNFNLVDDTTGGLDNQGTSLTLSGEFGKLALGDVSGALDATGDYTDVSPVFGGYRMDGDDMAISYTLPALIPNVTVVGSVSPDGANFAGDDPFNTEGEGGSSVSVTYSAGAFSVYYGTETYDEDVQPAVAQVADTDSMGVKYSSGPIMVAFETGSGKNMDLSAGTFPAHATALTDVDVDFTGVAGTYSMGDTKIGFEMQKIEDKTTPTSVTNRLDETTLFVTQSLGGGVSVYAATSSDEGGEDDTDVTRNAVGISFAF